MLKVRFKTILRKLSHFVSFIELSTALINSRSGAHGPSQVPCPLCPPHAKSAMAEACIELRADGEDFGSIALPAGVPPFRGFSTAVDDSEVGTPSPFGSAVAQRMGFRCNAPGSR